MQVDVSGLQREKEQDKGDDPERGGLPLAGGAAQARASSPRQRESAPQRHHWPQPIPKDRNQHNEEGDTVCIG